MEYWSGWFDLWGNLHHVYSAEGKAQLCFFDKDEFLTYSLAMIPDRSETSMSVYVLIDEFFAQAEMVSVRTDGALEPTGEKGFR